MKRANIILIALLSFALLAGCSDGSLNVGGGGDAGAGDADTSVSALTIDRIEPAEALPGESVVIFGQGIDPELDTVVAGNMEIDPTVSIDFALSSISGEEESDAVEGQITFVIPNSAEAGELPVKVVRDAIESNVVTITILADDANDNDDDDADDDDNVLPHVAQAQFTADLISAGDALNYASYDIYSFEIDLPEGVEEATLYAPLYGFALQGATGTRFEPEWDSRFSVQDRDDLLAAIDIVFQEAGATTADAANYEALYVDAFEKCFGGPAPSKGAIPLTCKPIRVTAETERVRTPCYDIDDFNGDFVFQHAVLEYVDADGNPQQVIYDYPF